MATAEKVTVTVEKIIEVEEEEIRLHLTREEALALVVVYARVGGVSGARDSITSIGEALVAELGLHVGNSWASASDELGVMFPESGIRLNAIQPDDTLSNPFDW